MVDADIQPDVAQLQELLDGRWARVRQLARDELRGPLFTPVPERGTEEHRDRVSAQLAALAGTELVGYGFPATYGGSDDVGASVVAFEMLVCDLSLMVKMGVQWGLFGGALHALGTEHHHRTYLPQVVSGQLLGCFAMTETGHGSDVQRLRTTAEYDAATEEFVVHTPDDDARKDYIGNAARDGRMAVVFAQLHTRGEEHGVHALLVPLRDEHGHPRPGVRIEDCGRKFGLNGVDNGRIWFDRVRVPRAALLDRYGQVAADGTYSSPIASRNRRFFTMLGTLVRGRISVAGGALNATQAALSIAVRYAETRRQGERAPGEEEVPLLDYRTHQRRLLPALARTYALRFAQEELVRALYDSAHVQTLNDHDQRELEARAAGIKAVATWHATRTIQTCREACGGAGYLAANRLPQLMADTEVFTTFEGDNTVLMQLVTKGLLTDYRQEFGELDPIGMARFVAGQFFGAVIERTAARSVIERLVDAAPGRSESSGVHDRGWHLRLLEDRERHMVDGLARRLRRAGSGRAAFEEFNNTQDHILAAARAHIDRVVLEAFVAAIERCTHDDTRTLLDLLCDLYVLSTIEEDRAWFLEHERLTTARAKAVKEGVNALCATLRPHARTLVDAFALPEEWLAAPIAVADGTGRAQEHSAVG
ncbi:acyl-CoA dehydrogenase [Lipingzhangella sp. LS1_29]|uniref:Acyl-CoA dehydrogenase n=1 Tax=Lipingzhangella rawalii TaxID=2055835 RepID=A0ABU2H5E2_9ACTN|nr:acyl-CoA dehydrogenase [Lipingzhangella rawalii]MDS1270526.1 acyl-CoA dehydrogenase [Lipingzhangella rawalii]